MKKYFYTNGNEKFGPFSLEELQEQGIRRETLVWFHELGDWHPAGKVPELTEIFRLFPPPLTREKHNSLESIDDGKATSIDILVFLSITYWSLTVYGSLILNRVQEDWYDTPIKFVVIATNILFAFVPTIFAFSIGHKILRAIAIPIGISIGGLILYQNIEWLIEILN